MADEPAMLMPYQGAWVPVTVRDMLRERDARLAALERENAALRDIVAAVAAMHTSDMRRAVSGSPELVTRARALLATQTPATAVAASGEAPQLAGVFDWVRYDAGPSLGMIEGEVVRIRHDSDRPPRADVDWHNDDLNSHLAPVPLADLEVVMTARERAAREQTTAGEAGEAFNAFNALYHADHEHQWHQIESRTDADTGRTWHRTRCEVCGFISELSVDPPQQPAD